VGVTGPDGAYLARFLLHKGYDVYGTSRNIGLARTDGLRALGIRDKVSLLSVSPVDFRSVSDAIERVAPQEIYNLSRQSSVALSFSQPAETLSSVTQATINFLEALKLGDISIHRDWGWAPDYVEAMWMMLQHDRPEDFVIASGVAHRLDEFVSAAFAEVGLAWQDHVECDDSLRRPTDIRYSRGDPSKAARQLGWRPRVGFAEIISRMVRAEQEKRTSPPSTQVELKLLK